jgi:hypothetical protein
MHKWREVEQVFAPIKAKLRECTANRERPDVIESFAATQSKVSERRTNRDLFNGGTLYQ